MFWFLNVAKKSFKAFFFFSAAIAVWNSLSGNYLLDILETAYENYNKL